MRDPEFLFQKKITLATETDGTGLWSITKNKVKIVLVEVSCYDKQDMSFGEVRAYFNENNWDIDKHGLIYTDKKWIKTFREQLAEKLDLKSKDLDISYSEQGMQGRDYVSMDCGPKLLKAVSKGKKIKKC